MSLVSDLTAQKKINVEFEITPHSLFPYIIRSHFSVDYQLRGYHSSVNLKFGLTLLLISLNNKIILYVKSNTLVMNCFLDNIRLPAITANRNVKCMGNIIYQ